MPHPLVQPQYVAYYVHVEFDAGSNVVRLSLRCDAWLRGDIIAWRIVLFVDIDIDVDIERGVD